MMKHILKAIKPAIIVTLFIVIYELIFFDQIGSLAEYIVHAFILAIFIGLGNYLEEKGWNSWKKVGSLFRRKKQD